MPFSKLIEHAKTVREYAYAPYSKFKVGAALLGKNGKIYTGCNVENSSYGLTCCAERNAVFKAVADGEEEFEAIAIVAGDEITPPCGACRQVLLEFGHDIKVVCANVKGQWEQYSIGELVPHSFDGHFLKE